MILKTISLWQPWGTAIVVLAKLIETRHWSTSYRGPILIHAAKTHQADYYLDEPEFQASLRGHDIAYGCLLGVADLVACMRTEHLRELPEVNRDRGGWRELDMGDYSDGRFGWVFKNIRKLPEPIPYRGAQGIFNAEIPDDVAISLGLTPSQAQEVLL
jgi:activating signal cointegrator 1